MKIFKTFVFFALITAAFFMTGCGSKNSLPAELEQIFKPGSGWLKLGVYGDPLSLNPLSHIESDSGQMTQHFVHAAPLHKLEDGTFKPYLFDSYTIYAGSSGTIILEGVWKSGLKWHDGVDFDPKDLEFTLEQMKKSENASPYAELAKDVLEVRSFGRGLRTRIVFARDSRQLLDLLTIGIIPEHVIKDQPVNSAKVEKTGVASEAWPLFVDQPVGLGPYVIRARQKGRYIDLQPFPDFFDKTARNPVLIRTYYDYQQLVTDFRAKKLDWINLPSMVAEQLETMKIDNLFFIRYPNPACMTWLFNTRNPVLADKRLRQALDLLADRKKIANEAPYKGQTLYSYPTASETAVDYDSQFAQALTLLDQMNWKDSDGDGIRDQNGQKLEINVFFNDDNLLRRAVAERFGEDCRRAGVSLVLKPVTWSELVSKHLKTGDFDTALVSLRFPEFGNLNSFLHSQQAPGKNDSGLNFFQVADEELDAVLTRLDSMLEIENVASDKTFLNEYLQDERPMAVLFRPYDIGIMHEASGSAQAKCPFWNDVLNWKALFGPADSKL